MGARRGRAGVDGSAVDAMPPHAGSESRTVRATARVEVASDRGVFMISVAAELADMHPQTLRMYEARGLIEPKRSPKGTRLYSQTGRRAAAAHPGDDR